MLLFQIFVLFVYRNSLIHFFKRISFVFLFSPSCLVLVSGNVCRLSIADFGRKHLASGKHICRSVGFWRLKWPKGRWWLQYGDSFFQSLVCERLTFALRLIRFHSWEKNLIKLISEICQSPQPVCKSRMRKFVLIVFLWDYKPIPRRWCGFL